MAAEDTDANASVLKLGSHSWVVCEAEDQTAGGVHVEALQ